MKMPSFYPMDSLQNLTMLQIMENSEFHWRADTNLTEGLLHCVLHFFPSLI